MINFGEWFPFNAHAGDAHPVNGGARAGPPHACARGCAPQAIHQHAHAGDVRQHAYDGDRGSPAGGDGYADAALRMPARPPAASPPEQPGR